MVLIILKNLCLKINPLSPSILSLYQKMNFENGQIIVIDLKSISIQNVK